MTRLCLKRALELSPVRFGCPPTTTKDIELLNWERGRCGATEFEAGLELATHLLTGMLSLPVIQQEVQQIRNHHYLGCQHVQPPRFPVTFS